MATDQSVKATYLVTFRADVMPVEIECSRWDAGIWGYSFYDDDLEPPHDCTHSFPLGVIQSVELVLDSDCPTGKSPKT